MLKFVKQESQLRQVVWEWGREVIPLRKAVIKADLTLVTELETIISEFKKFNDSVYILRKRKYSLIEDLK